MKKNKITRKRHRFQVISRHKSVPPQTFDIGTVGNILVMLELVRPLKVDSFEAALKSPGRFSTFPDHSANKCWRSGKPSRV